MSGYTPVFDTLFTGSLAGRYPDTAAWMFFLALADKHGCVDMTPQYISTVTGMPLDDLLGCIERFMDPDPMSRSRENEGRRLVLLDDTRPWGWRIVNHGKYREKARKAAYDSKRTESGADAERKRRERGSVPTCPDASRAVPLSNTNTNKEEDIRQPRLAVAPDFHEKVIAAYHELLPDLPRVKTWNDRRRRKLAARIRERLKAGKPADTLDYWRSVFGKAAASDFLCGRKTDWRANLEFLLEPKHFEKLIEGGYDNNRGRRQ